MSKYELAVVLNAKIEDEERAKVLEKVMLPDLAALSQTLKRVARRSLLMTSRRCQKDTSISFTSKLKHQLLPKSRTESASWITFFVS